MQGKRLSKRYKFGITAFLTCFLNVPIVGFSSGNPVSNSIILGIITEQKHAYEMGYACNPYLRASRLGKLASERIDFERPNVSSPIYVPVLFSLMTGLSVSIIAMEENVVQRNQEPLVVFECKLGRLFSLAGYQAAYAGKIRLTSATLENVLKNPIVCNFSRYLTQNDRERREQSIQSRKQFNKYSGERSFPRIALSINPHNTSYLPPLDWVETDKKTDLYSSWKAVNVINEILEIPKSMDWDKLIETYLPPLPDNFAFPNHGLPAFITVKQDNYIGWWGVDFTDNECKLYRYLFAWLTEAVDIQIGQLTQVLEDTGIKSNVLVIFSNDYGNQDAAYMAYLKG